MGQNFNPSFLIPPPYSLARPHPHREREDSVPFPGACRRPAPGAGGRGLRHHVGSQSPAPGAGGRGSAPGASGRGSPPAPGPDGRGVAPGDGGQGPASAPTASLATAASSPHRAGSERTGACTRVGGRQPEGYAEPWAGATPAAGVGSVGPGARAMAGGQLRCTSGQGPCRSVRSSSGPRWLSFVHAFFCVFL